MPTPLSLPTTTASYFHSAQNPLDGCGWVICGLCLCLCVCLRNFKAAFSKTEMEADAQGAFCISSILSVVLTSFSTKWNFPFKSLGRFENMIWVCPRILFCGPPSGPKGPQRRNPPSPLVTNCQHLLEPPPSAFGRRSLCQCIEGEQISMWH